MVSLVRLHVQTSLADVCAAIKTTIFGQLNWSIRRPTEKQAKQRKRDRRFEAQRARTMAPDPRKEKEEQILKHTGWRG